MLAASDPLKFPVQSPVPADVEERFPTQDGLIIDTASGRALLTRSLREEGYSVGRILAEIDISELLRVRRQVLLTLVAVNAGLALGFADDWVLRAQAHAETPERTKRIRGTRSSRTR